MTNNEKEVNVEVVEKKKASHHGRNVKWFRKQKGYSQDYLASQITIQEATQQIVSDWEKEDELSLELLTDIAKILDIGVSWLQESILDDEAIFSQDGNNNTNFQRNDSVTFTVHNPLEAMERAYKDTTKKISAAYSDANTKISGAYNDAKAIFETHQNKTEEFYKYMIEEQKKEIERVTVENSLLRDKFIVIVEKIADKI